MRINVFEGARRISAVLLAAWTIAICLYGYSHLPRHANITLVIDAPGGTPYLDDQECHPDDAKFFPYITLDTGRYVSIVACLRSYPVSNGLRYVPYGYADDGSLLMDQRFSRTVKAYATQLENAFPITETDRTEATKRWMKSASETGKDIILAWFLGVLIGWIAIKVIGWIARGFLETY